MPGAITTIVNAISADVVAGLALLGLPALGDGGITLGSAEVAANGAPPRVVLEPLTSRFGPADKAIAAAVTAGTTRRPYTYPADLLAVLSARSLGTEWITFRVHVWGIGDPSPGATNTPGGDLDATHALKQQVIRSCLRIAPGVSILDGARWASTEGRDTSVNVSGWYVAFGLEFAVPIQDYPLDFVPHGTKPLITTTIQPGDGSAPEAGPTIS